MVLHYSVGTDAVACGRNDHNVTATSQRDRVTCRNCLRSERFTSSIAVMESVVSVGKAHAVYNWRSAWAKKALAERPWDRLPRGMERASDLK